MCSAASMCWSSFICRAGLMSIPARIRQWRGVQEQSDRRTETGARSALRDEAINRRSENHANSILLTSSRIHVGGRRVSPLRPDLHRRRPRKSYASACICADDRSVRTGRRRHDATVSKCISTSTTARFAGAKVVPIIEDTQGKPDTAVTKAKKLILQDHVQMLVGGVLAPEPAMRWRRCDRRKDRLHRFGASGRRSHAASARQLSIFHSNQLDALAAASSAWPMGMRPGLQESYHCRCRLCIRL